MPIVSVIVPVYNVEDVLHYCVDSILSQSFIDFELILVDDGSKDNSGNICDEYSKKDNRIVVIHKNNGGVSSARNIGIDVAKGKYICFVDSDDYLDSKYLECLLDTKHAYLHCDNVWSKFKTVDSYSSTNNPLELKYKIYSVSNIMTLHEQWLDAGPVCKLYNRRIIIENNLKFDESISLGEDLIFNYMYLDCTNGFIIVIDCALYNYMHLSNNSLSNKYYENLLEIYNKLNSIMYKYINKWNCGDEQLKKYYNSCFFKYEVIFKNTFHKENHLCTKQRIQYNNKIIKTKAFFEVYKKMAYKPNILYKFAYFTKNYRMVMLVDKLFNIIK